MANDRQGSFTLQFKSSFCLGTDVPSTYIQHNLNKCNFFIYVEQLERSPTRPITSRLDKSPPRPISSRLGVEKPQPVSSRLSQPVSSRLGITRPLRRQAEDTSLEESKSPPKKVCDRSIIVFNVNHLVFTSAAFSI